MTAAAEQTVLTPTAGRVAKRLLFWVGVLAFILVIGLVTLATAGSNTNGPDLGASNAAPGGSMALVEVLKQQGVDVVEASSLAEAQGAIDDPASTTLLFYDRDLILDRDQLKTVATLADTIVLVDPDFSQLRALAPDVAQAGYVGDAGIDADCDVTAVQKAETVSGGGSGFRMIGTSDATECLGSGDGVYSLIQLDDGRVSVLGATAALTNELIINDGNAAFALNLLGENDTLVWYFPGIDDVADTSPETIGQLTPGWVTPVLSLLVLTFLAAAIWRGRRFGPLVVENLPVTVRASETMLGRARLYQKSSARLRALDALRIGSVQRLAKLCGLPRLATVDDVIASCAAVTGIQVAEIRSLLIDAHPATDSDLMRLSDALLTLERTVASAVRP